MKRRLVRAYAFQCLVSYRRFLSRQWVGVRREIDAAALYFLTLALLALAYWIQG